VALLAAIFVGLVFLDGTERWVVIVVGALVEVVEITVMLRYSRRRRPAVGSQTLIGRAAVAATDCTPHGQVRIDGEIWSASCPDGCRAGDTVTVTSVDGLILTVAAAAGR
jgi:membrane protein implicated in regulation of membrane protease activity